MFSGNVVMALMSHGDVLIIMFPVDVLMVIMFPEDVLRGSAWSDEIVLPVDIYNRENCPGDRIKRWTVCNTTPVHDRSLLVSLCIKSRKVHVTHDLSVKQRTGKRFLKKFLKKQTTNVRTLLLSRSMCVVCVFGVFVAAWRSQK